MTPTRTSTTSSARSGSCMRRTAPTPSARAALVRHRWLAIHSQMYGFLGRRQHLEQADALVEAQAQTASVRVFHYELMLFLHEHGWQALPWEKGQRCPEPLALPEPGASASSSGDFLSVGHRRWFYRPLEASILAAYLKAMVHAQRSSRRVFGASRTRPRPSSMVP